MTSPRVARHCLMHPLQRVWCYEFKSTGKHDNGGLWVRTIRHTGSTYLGGVQFARMGVVDAFKHVAIGVHRGRGRVTVSLELPICPALQVLVAQAQQVPRVDQVVTDTVAVRAKLWATDQNNTTLDTWDYAHSQPATDIGDSNKEIVPLDDSFTPYLLTVNKIPSCASTCSVIDVRCNQSKAKSENTPFVT